MLKRSDVNNIRALFVYHGMSFNRLALKYGVNEKRIRDLCRDVSPATDPGPVPEECRLGIYRGYREVIEPILREHGCTWAMFMGISRASKISVCRWQAWSELRANGKKLLHIGEFCGRDHTTVRYGIARFREGRVPYEGCFGRPVREAAE